MNKGIEIQFDSSTIKLQAIGIIEDVRGTASCVYKLDDHSARLLYERRTHLFSADYFYRIGKESLAQTFFEKAKFISL